MFRIPSFRKLNTTNSFTFESDHPIKIKDTNISKGTKELIFDVVSLNLIGEEIHSKDLTGAFTYDHASHPCLWISQTIDIDATQYNSFICIREIRIDIPIEKNSFSAFLFSLGWVNLNHFYRRKFQIFFREMRIIENYLTSHFKWCEYDVHFVSNNHDDVFGFSISLEGEDIIFIKDTYPSDETFVYCYDVQLFEYDREKTISLIISKIDQLTSELLQEEISSIYDSVEVLFSGREPLPRLVLRAMILENSLKILRKMIGKLSI